MFHTTLKVQMSTEPGPLGISKSVSRRIASIRTIGSINVAHQVSTESLYVSFAVSNRCPIRLAVSSRKLSDSSIFVTYEESSRFVPVGTSVTVRVINVLTLSK